MRLCSVSGKLVSHAILLIDAAFYDYTVISEYGGNIEIAWLDFLDASTRGIRTTITLGTIILTILANCPWS